MTEISCPTKTTLVLFHMCSPECPYPEEIERHVASCEKCRAFLACIKDSPEEMRASAQRAREKAMERIERLRQGC